MIRVMIDNQRILLVKFGMGSNTKANTKIQEGQITNDMYIQTYI